MTVQSQKFLFGSKEPVELVEKGISRQMLGFNDEIMMARVSFDEGSEGYVHTHRHSQVTYVESGEFEVNVNGEKKVLCAGDCFFIPPHEPHGAICRKAGVLLDVFSPMREDFLVGNK